MSPPRLAIVGLLLAALAGAPAGAVATTAFQVGPPVLVSGPSPFAACPIGATDPDRVDYENAEVEPFVAVNPTDPGNVIGVFQQDRWADGAARATVAARSSDGGSSWARSFARVSACSGGDPAYRRATDPWVSFDAAGRAYQSALAVDSGVLGRSAVLVSTSTDGGATWAAPVVVAEDRDPIHFNDKDSITADPIRPGHAYATWLRGNLPGEIVDPARLAHARSARGSPMIARTTDGGRTWTAPEPMTNANLFAQGNQIVVLPDGTLVDVFAALSDGVAGAAKGKESYIGTLRSLDGGRTWSRPTKIAPLGTAVLTNPDVPNPSSLSQTVRAGDFLPAIAVDRQTGTIYVVWADGLGTPVNHVVLVRSTDGGRHWTSPRRVGLTPDGTHSFNGVVAVTDEGTVAVMYYDFRANDAAPGLPTDVWLSHSTDAGQTWLQQHIDGPFDMQRAPVSRGWFLGDYQGLAAAGGDLVLLFATTQGDAANVYAVRASR